MTFVYSATRWLEIQECLVREERLTDARQKPATKATLDEVVCWGFLPESSIAP